MGRTLLQTYQILADPRDKPLPSEPPTTSTDNKMGPQNQTQQPTLDSSMGLTILVLLTALFFMGFFSIYIRRFAHESPVELSRRRRLRSGLASSVPNLTSTRLCTRRGLAFTSIQALPVVEYGSEFEKRHPICAVCLAEFEEGESVKVLPFCQHLFHVECIDAWLVARATCPVCRTSRVFKEKEEEEEERVGVVLSSDGDDGGGGGVRRCCSCSEIEVVVEGSEEGREGLQRTRSF